ncbi:succinate dehydrogenase assembly factor 2 [Altererythrobacter aurantiacus]|uniref:FAD assembly factor SdhE n=1 Tax=Parapontixanthobacter aurantiacus TaxID=1463599 RepID=A0A844ZDV5_9SPHN|nr:succinate dehydrogenase assembly factor 2 [Parapontixanthobacter aurantiacus]MXO85130.1 succinate dehydrogenase assembly factor 2 [Parapontixanthobacter aurantiacus]
MHESDDLKRRFARAKFRAWHRGTREADYMIGGFFDRYAAEWSAAELAWFEALLDEDDVDVMAWALQAAPAPEHIEGRQLEFMQRLDYVGIGPTAADRK